MAIRQAGTHRPVSAHPPVLAGERMKPIQADEGSLRISKLEAAAWLAFRYPMLRPGLRTYAASRRMTLRSIFVALRDELGRRPSLTTRSPLSIREFVRNEHPPKIRNDVFGGSSLQCARNEILDQVTKKYPSLTHLNAEKWAEEHGFEPFALPKPVNNYDPQSAALWTLPMTTAWVIWRTTEMVCRVVPSKGPRVPEWVEHAGTFDLELPMDWSVSEVFSYATSSSEKRIMEVAEARNNMLTKLQNGELRALSDQKSIKPKQWLSLRLDSHDALRPSSVCNVSGGRAGFDDVEVIRDEVLNIWPAPGRTAKIIPSDAEVEKVIRVAIATKGANLKVLEAEKICAEKCAGVKRNKIRALLKKVQGPAKQGRPPKPK